jgi:hypothetical protein|tara:strand:+ start:1144 stop:1407 length:264 start_codon:yes stop_codon:yes gene_type:complete
MRLFVYKSLFIFLLLMVFYKITIGSLIKELDYKINNFISKEKIEKSKSKIRDEINTAVKKDRILSKEDAKLLKLFIEKVKMELKNTN